MYKIILTGGGTAGHVMPNIALLGELRKYFDVFYIGGKNGIEEKIAKDNGIPYYSTDTVKFSRASIISNLKIPFVMPKCVSQARALLKEIKPDIVFAKGGFVSLPTAFAAKKENIPVVLHEADTSLGLANKLVARFAALAVTSSPDVKCPCPIKMLGNPLRPSIFEGDKERIFLRHRLDRRKKTLLIMGGSSGARAINECVYQCVGKLSERYNVLHLTGKNAKKLTLDGYVQIEYADDIKDYLAAADIAVSRSGASAAAELLASGVKTLFIPLPKGASRGDQLKNAEDMRSKGYCNVLPQEELTPQTLLSAVAETETAKFKSYPYDRDTPAKIVAELLKVVKNN